MQRNTLSISDDAATRIEQLPDFMVPSIPGYAAKWAELISWLPIMDQIQLWENIQIQIKKLRAEGKIPPENVPAVPLQLQAEARRLRVQTSQQRR